MERKGQDNMKARIYTEDELSILRKNIFVLDVKYKRYIEYDPVFKLWAIMMRLEFPELSAVEIFELGGFDTSILNRNLPRNRIYEWLDNYKRFGSDFFISDLPYYSLNRSAEEKGRDEFKIKLLSSVLEKLKEFN